MPIYVCPKCGRTVEKPEGTYYCSVCGPSYIMTQVSEVPTEAWREGYRLGYLDGGGLVRKFSSDELVKAYEKVCARFVEDRDLCIKGFLEGLAARIDDIREIVEAEYQSKFGRKIPKTKVS